MGTGHGILHGLLIQMEGLIFMSAKYKSGDVVRLVCHNIFEAARSAVGFNNSMLDMLGEVHIIQRSVVRQQDGVLVYYMEGSRWVWREDWVEPAFGRVDVYENV
jgi:hypothetical protein